MRLLRSLSLLLPILLCLTLFPLAEASVGWSQIYEGGDDAYGYAIVKTQDDGYAVAGEITRYYNYTFDNDFYLIKTDSEGNLQWNNSYGNTGDNKETAHALVATSDGGYALAGSASVWLPDSFYSDTCDFRLVKTDSAGNMLWNKTYGGEGDAYMENAYSLVATSDGGYALAGSQGPLRGETDTWLVKTDSEGNMLWNRTFNGPDSDAATALVATSDGGYAIAGTMRINDTYTGGFLMKTDAQGNLQWSRTYGTTNDFVSALVETSDGGYAMAGTTMQTGNADFWLIKTNSLGTMQWNRTYGSQGTIMETANGLVTTLDGGYAVAGEVIIGDFAVGNKDVWLVKTDALGVMEWNQTYASNDSNFETAYNLVINDDGGYTLACSSLNVTTSKSDIWLIRTDEFGVVPEHLSLLTLSLVIAATLPLLFCKKRLLRKH